MRKTKIIATVGPASDSSEVLKSLIKAGMNVARLNFSHGTPETHRKTIEKIRRIARELDKPVAILQDLPGPKIRVGELPTEGVLLKPGAEFTLTSRQIAGSENGVSISYAGLSGDVRSGQRILLADGALELEVLGVQDADIRCRVVTGGVLTSRKGVNVPSGNLSLDPLTDRDIELLKFGLGAGVDIVALSFVRCCDEIKRAREIMGESGRTVPIIAKIERKEALDNIDDILEAADGIMVARGDLGVEIPLEQVPGIQKSLIHQSNQRGKSVITATQMLRSMVDSNRPTRAEVTDVANAVLDGTDAVMLSEESAVGRYPEESVRCMVRIIQEAEKGFPHEKFLDQDLDQWDVTGSVCHGACTLADHLRVALIIAFTQSGTTARTLSRFRPVPPVLALTPDTGVAQQLGVYWGIETRVIPALDNTDTMMEQAVAIARDSGMVSPGDTVVITAGLPVLSRGTTNMLRVTRV